MKTYGFADSRGNELTRGYQGHEDQARALAQKFADERDEPIDYWDESDVSGREGEGELSESLVTVYPAQQQSDTDDSDIEALSSEAAQAGDLTQVELCARALDGDKIARAECLRVISDAAAMRDDEGDEA